MTHHARVYTDWTPHSTVVRCTCGWREVATRRTIALAAAAAHQAAVHGNWKQAQKLNGRAERVAATAARKQGVQA